MFVCVVPVSQLSLGAAPTSISLKRKGSFSLKAITLALEKNLPRKNFSYLKVIGKAFPYKEGSSYLKAKLDETNIDENVE